MKERFLAKLISPDNGADLQYDPSSGQLSDPGKQYVYEQKKGVPVLLPEGAMETVRQAEQHEKLGSEFHYVDHYMRDAEVFDYFQPYEDAATRHENRRLHETIIHAVPSGTGEILDVGCGNAWVAQHFCPRGVTVYSMDIALANTIRALKTYPFDNHFALVADVYALPLRSHSFDCIIASEIIEHVPDPGAFLAALLRVLKPGGVLIVTTPYNEKIIYSLCIHCNRPTPLNAHLHSFTENKLLGLLQEASRPDAKVFTFGNKALIKLRTHVILRYLPFSLWGWVDRVANAVLRKPSRILLEVKRGKVYEASKV